MAQHNSFLSTLKNGVTGFFRNLRTPFSGQKRRREDNDTELPESKLPTGSRSELGARSNGIAEKPEQLLSARSHKTTNIHLELAATNAESTLTSVSLGLPLMGPRVKELSPAPCNVKPQAKETQLMGQQHAGQQALCTADPHARQNASAVLSAATRSEPEAAGGRLTTGQLAARSGLVQDPSVPLAAALHTPQPALLGTGTRSDLPGASVSDTPIDGCFQPRQLNFPTPQPSTQLTPYMANVHIRNTPAPPSRSYFWSTALDVQMGPAGGTATQNGPIAGPGAQARSSIAGPAAAMRPDGVPASGNRAWQSGGPPAAHRPPVFPSFAHLQQARGALPLRPSAASAPVPVPAAVPSPPQRFINELRSYLEDVAAGKPHGTTAEQLTQNVQAWQERQQHAARVPLPGSPVIEDGGLVGDDEEDAKLQAKIRETAKAVGHLKEGLAKACRTAGMGGSVPAAAAAGSLLAARSALVASSAPAAAAALEAAQKKIDANREAIRNLHRQAEQDTQRQLQAAQAAAQAQQQQKQAQQASAAAAAAAPARGAAPAAAAAPVPMGRRPQPAAPAPAAEEEDEVCDLVSSDEEEEERQEEYDEEEGEGEEGESEEEQAEEDVGALSQQLAALMRANPALRTATAAEQRTYQRVFDKHGNPQEVLLAFAPNTATDIKLTRDKLQCMAPTVWLNDEAINLYMLLLQERDTRLRSAANGAGGRAPRCHFFNSFFYNKLFQDERKYNYANVRRWTMPTRLKNALQASPEVLELDRIIVPIHQGMHWTCAVVDLRDKAVRYYDSLMGRDKALPGHLLQWVADESADKIKSRWDTSAWRVEYPTAIPRQLNGCDCGVFAIMFADCLGRGVDFDFDQSDMELLRVRVLHRLVSLRVD